MLKKIKIRSKKKESINITLKQIKKNLFTIPYTVVIKCENSEQSYSSFDVVTFERNFVSIRLWLIPERSQYDSVRCCSHDCEIF